MNEEQFVNIDLNDDNVCSICKLGTDKETLSFCHVCFELNIEGVARSDLLHTRSLRGHRDCFEKFHLIAKQDFPRSKLSKSTYEGVKTLLSKKLHRIVHYAQNRDFEGDPEGPRQHQLFPFRPPAERRLPPRSDSGVPRYSATWREGGPRGGGPGRGEPAGLRLEMASAAGAPLRPKGPPWAEGDGPTREKEAEARGPDSGVRRPRYSREELHSLSLGEVEELNGRLRQQIQEVFEELARQVQEKDSLASELHVRHVAIEQLLKNYSRLPCVQVGRAAGVKPDPPVDN
ncbi:protein EURL homolog [Ornithorhynchus anatinus]|uniref:Chromosome 21 open reading frame 91 n=1 Tax=Ornithorhynchus anatinus TaxID=9258 RepID=A0A6I8N0I9_ORNAN|nr:protein EURL homolog [Ornithorhynchus anatinus]XP_028938411.1 protein EURL homolog [Ornithorhynchus anatinus]XP_028938412.1 protein EURL homolog [Ornithorhynchus anatinus]